MTEALKKKSKLRGVLADTTPLQNKAYRRLWMANIVTVIGAQLSIVAVPQQIFEITRSSAYVGLTGVFGLVPLIVFGLWGGALADVMDRRTLLTITTVGLISTSTLLWLQAFADLNNVWVVLCLLAVQQAFFAVNQPTRSAIIPRLLPGAQLPAANSLNMTVMNFGAIAGPLIAGTMIPLAGLQTLYLVDSIALFATLWAVIRLPRIPPAEAGRRAGLRSVVEGFTYLATQKVLLASFVVDIIAMVFGMPRALFPQIAHDTFGDPASGGLVLGLLFAALSAGAVLGGVFSGWLPRVERQGLAVIVCIVVWGLAMVGFGVSVGMATSGGVSVALWIALAFLALGGGADMISAAFRSTMLQQVATDDMRGRLQGVFIVVVAGGPRIGDVLHGASAAMVGTAAAAAGGGVLVVVGVVIAAVALPAFIRYRVTRVDNGHHG
ncbi:MFS transporter [Rhodococcus sp. BP-252]|uniref:MFS transporter n=1 Tax=unclassified Rhodococcus (in: high G+C Gram-positive bacteria) TaxID=192944 RepID=UPI001C9B7C91|nr:MULTISPECIES: MFS transporter [unclassified Rhodococcus (in: high G+C Gram-positive bacteria)]MBY6413062.1 MFS transporter [Rhodococcus sp. BP-320]MBY6417775.1 MFS transporter [Rhodococcus sp. BP-321]MBY6423925.1 MFS transporter [Rhodococcus sp. BP-324]MBY6427804.1 MFS transporter [Rhodococcus sp. BP-323]MBY6431803.1 MFS transporter [Rhodococcus sp. BP-322]